MAVTQSKVNKDAKTGNKETTCVTRDAAQLVPVMPKADWPSLARDGGTKSMYSFSSLLVSEFREGPGSRVYLKDFPPIQIALSS